MALPVSNFKNMFLALFAVTFVASAILGVVNEATKSAIIKADIEQQNSAIATILPPFAYLGSAYKVLPAGEQDSLQFFPAFSKDSSLIGTAVKSYSRKGFSGLITVMVGLSSDGNISGFKILEHKETPGLGSRMALWFSDKSKPKQSILGINPEISNFAVVKDGGSIDAITAATISSRAFLESVKRAHKAWKNDSSNHKLKSTTVKTELSKKGGAL
ncbi:MAG: RnfABCDGE type electron transport complex subunit G [Prolixibacteraceae bacterium]